MNDLIAKSLLLLLTTLVGAVCVLIASRHGVVLPRLPQLGTGAL